MLRSLEKVRKRVKCIRLLPMVDNNLGPDRQSKGSRSQSLQTTNPLIARPLSGSPKCAMCMVLSCTCLEPRHFPYSYYYYRTSGIAAAVNTCNVFSFYAVWTEHRTRHLSYAEQMCYVLCHGCRFRVKYIVTANADLDLALR